MNAQEYFSIVGATFTIIAVSYLTMNIIDGLISLFKQWYKHRKKK